MRNCDSSLLSSEECMNRATQNESTKVLYFTAVIIILKSTFTNRTVQITITSPIEAHTWDLK